MVLTREEKEKLVLDLYNHQQFSMLKTAITTTIFKKNVTLIDASSIFNANFRDKQNG